MKIFTTPRMERCIGCHSCSLADKLKPVSRYIQGFRWKVRSDTGFDPKTVKIPRRFTEVTTWRGPIDENFLLALKNAYADRILELAKGEEAN